MPIAVEGKRGILTPVELKKHLRPDIYYIRVLKSMRRGRNFSSLTC
jgi:hypothetical protein